VADSVPVTVQPYTAPPAAIRVGADALVRMRSDGAKGLDSLPESTQGFWLRDSAATLTGAGPLLEAAALRSYADRHHRLAGGHGPIWPPGGGDPIEPEAYCACGCSWSEDDGGCPERAQLLEDAAALDGGRGASAREVAGG
jgi:hypothetical protein